MKIKHKYIARQSMGHFVILLTILFFLYPFVYMLFTSLKSLPEIMRSGIGLIPKAFTLENYVSVFTKLPVLKMIGNSAFIATFTMVLKLLTSILASYALVFIPNKYSSKIFYFFLLTMFIPFSVIMLPNYLTLSKINLVNTLVGVALPQLADATGIFRIRQAMKSVPKALIEAARLDNIPHMVCLRKIVLPLIKPSTYSMAIFFFVNSWNEYFWPLLILRSKEVQTITLSMKYFMGSEGSASWGSVMALATLSVLPPLILYLFAQRSIISTFMSSGIKE